MTKGWKSESARHSLASKGIKTSKKTKPLFRLQRAKILINEAEKELKEYKKTGKYKNYSQATEKSWLAYKQYISEKAGKNIVKSQLIKKESKNRKLTDSYNEALALHTLSFGADVLLPADYIKPKIMKIKKVIVN